MKDENIKVFTSMQKSFRLFRLQSKTGEYLADNVRLNSFSGIAFMPMVTSREELSIVVKRFFGTKGYSKFLPRYIFIKKFMYQPSFVSGRKQVVTNNLMQTINNVELNLSNLRTQPNYRYMDSKNLIVDCTDQFNLLFPRNKDFLTKQNVIV